ncbi:hypothetical protein BKA62DRAFT_695447 [Auriculariales sp. MPI-PUGE-AT-0066]|nr:hypothetical protein BKA62DRAFT_695447 [Auriculariales sp. MPI-PUGE-AT-0066]
MATNSDPIRDLFGQQKLSVLKNALNPQLDDLLFALEPHLGVEATDRMRNAPENAITELLTFVRRSKNPELVSEFRNMVLQTESIKPLLSVAAREDAKRYEGSGSTVEGPGVSGFATETKSPNSLGQNNVNEKKDSSPARSSTENKSGTGSFKLAELGWREIRTFQELEEVLKGVADGESGTVVVCTDEKQKPLSPQFHKALRAMAAGYRDNKALNFAVADLGNSKLRPVSNRFNIASPSVLVFFNSTFMRTEGEDIDGIRNHIQQCIHDIKSLPDTFDEIHLATSFVRELRPHLVHVLPHIERRAPLEFRVLLKTIQGTCGHFSRKGEPMMTCFTCSPNPFVRADFCTRCFDSSDHAGHKFQHSTAPSDDVYCDCGAMVGGTLVGVRCAKHKREHESASTTNGADIPPEIMMLHMLGMMGGLNMDH